MNRIHIILVVCLFGILACGRVDVGYNNGSSNQTSSIIPAEMYYHTAGSCQNGDFAFVLLSSAGLQLWTDPTQVVTAQIELFLHEDGSYSAHYTEYDANGAQSFEKRWSSSYEIDADEGSIHIKDLGTGKVIGRATGQVLEVQLEVNINNPLLNGKTADFRLQDSSQGEDQDSAAYCQY